MDGNPTPLQCAELSAIHPSIRLGTSSWTHQFWKGQIYHRTYASEAKFNLFSLEEYASLGLFRVVEIDSSFYRPPQAETLEKYAALVPDDFRFTAKIWEHLSIPEFPGMKRYGKVAGQHNASFLDPAVFHDQVLPPFRTPSFRQKFSSFLLQFPRMDSALATSRSFLARLKDFLDAFPRDFGLTIEIRNPELLTSPYLSLLNSYGVAHCFNSWFCMPALINQMKAVAAAGGSTAGFYYARLVTPLGMRYEQAGSQFAPFFKITQRNEQVRKDVLRLVHRALQRNVPAYVIVNNRFEGNSPCTILELHERITAIAADS